MQRLHNLYVEAHSISDELKFNKILKEYLFTKAQYERGLYGPAVDNATLVGYRLKCMIHLIDLFFLDRKRAVIEVPPLKITV